MEEGKDKFYKKKWFIILMIVLGLIIIGLIASPDNEEKSDTDSREKGKITFKVSSTETLGDDFECVVNVSGKEKSNGKEKDVNDNYTAKLDKEYHLDYKTGTYKLKLDTSSLNTDVNIYKEKELTINYDGEHKEFVTLWVALDTEAMAKKQSEKNAINQQSQQPQQGGGSQEVAKEYILVTTTGTFHLAGCRALKRAKDGNKQTVVATYSEMIARGYKPCGICL